MLTLYRPNKKNTGCLLSVSFNSKSDKRGVFLKFIKQTGWNDNRASFANGVSIVTKLSLEEVGQVINSLETFSSLEKPFYHDSRDGTPTHINLSLYKDAMLAFSIMKGEDKTGILLNKGDCVLVSEFLKFSLNHIFTGIYSDEIKRMKEYETGSQNSNYGKSNKTNGVKGVEEFMGSEKSSQEVSDDDDIPF
jgi:hypothetical protein